MNSLNYNEWLSQNPGKNINDYYNQTGKTISIAEMPTIEKQSHLPNERGQHLISQLPFAVNIKISPIRLFLYTGIVMGSGVLWIFIFWGLVALGFGTHFFQNLFLSLFK